jgi:proteic killer suppression protein
LISSFGDKTTEALFHARTGEPTRRLPPHVVQAALRKLDLLNAARSLQDMASPPGNRLEALKGNLQGFHSVRVNDQWRIIFRWVDGDASEVSLLDYH